MASYEEMKTLFGDAELRNRCEVAIITKAMTVLAQSDVTDLQRELISKVFGDVKAYSQKALYALVVQHKDKPEADIKGMDDLAIQASVDLSADILMGV